MKKRHALVLSASALTAVNVVSAVVVKFSAKESYENERNNVI